MQKRNILNSPRLSELKNKRRKFFLNKILLILFSFLVILAGISYLSRISRLNISEIEITGNKIVETKAIKSTVENIIKEKYLWVFPKTNIFFYPKNNIQKELADKFKRLKDIKFSIKNGTVLEVSVAERTASYTWCGNTPVVESEEKCYFLDEDGYIFDEAPYFSGEVYFKFYGVTHEARPNMLGLASQIDAPSGTYFLREYFKKLIVFKNAVETMKLKPVGLYALSNGDIKLLLSVPNTLSISPEIIFKLDSDLEIVAENLQTALDTEPLKTDIVKRYSSLLYIDLRFGNKVIYKFQ